MRDLLTDAEEEAVLLALGPRLEWTQVPPFGPGRTCYWESQYLPDYPSQRARWYEITYSPQEGDEY